MKTYITDIIPKIKKYSQKLDNLITLTNKHWVVIDELKNSKFVYIFRDNSELLISQNGKVEKGKWEYLGPDALLIERNDGAYLFRHGFFDSNILALKVDGTEEYVFLVNELNFDGDFSSIEKVLSFLETKYLKDKPQKKIGNIINSKITFQSHVVEKETGNQFIVINIDEEGNYVCKKNNGLDFVHRLFTEDEIEFFSEYAEKK